MNSFPSAPESTDATADSLSTLRNGLRLADRFALFVAIVNRPTDRDALIRELTESVPDLRISTVRLTESTADILDEVLQQAGNPPPGPVMVVDFDAAIPSDAAYHPILQTLNLRRPEWPKEVPYPVIFWVPEYVFTLLAREAPDFLDWRSLSAFFTETTERDLIPLRSDVWEGGGNRSFTRAQRMARIAELKQRLDLYESEQTDKRVLAARMEWLSELGLHQWQLGVPGRAVASLNEALAIARELGEQRGMGKALGVLGTVWNGLGDTNKAIDLFVETVAIARGIGDRRMEGSALSNLGVAWANLGDTVQAIGFDEQALAIARGIGDRRMEGSALSNLGVAWANLEHTHKAIGFYEQALAIARESGDKMLIGNALGNLGNAYGKLGEARRAIDHHEQRLALAREIGDRRGEGDVLLNLGVTHKKFGDTRRAITFYYQALGIAREIGDRHVEAFASFNIGLTLYQIGQRDEAIHLTEYALSVFSAIRSPHAEAVRCQLVEWRGEANLPYNINLAIYDVGRSQESLRQMERALTLDHEMEDRKVGRDAENTGSD